MQNVHLFLTLLHQCFPPPAGKRHAVTLRNKNELCIQVAIAEGFYVCNFDSEDYEKAPMALVAEIYDLIHSDLKKEEVSQAEVVKEP